MRALELNAEYYGISRLQLMENAGKNIATEILNRFKPKETKIAVFCGLGGNGGDGFVAARHLACQGFKVDVFLAGKAQQIIDENARKNWEALTNLKSSVSMHEIYDSSLLLEVKAEVIVDALLGTGLTGPPKPPILNMIKLINEAKGFKLAVDIPSGLDSDQGKALGEAVKANLTVTFHKAKPGLIKAKEYTGELLVTNIGIPEEIESYAGPGDVAALVKPRPPESHKGDFGRLLVIGGSETYVGAPAFVAQAALRAGVDLAYIAAPRETAYAISSMSPDLITIKLEGEYLNKETLSVIRRNLDKATSVVIGPGLGMQKETQEAVKEIIRIVNEKKIPMLIDADALKAFAEFKHRLATPAVLTPHVGEYEILTGTKLPQNTEGRISLVKQTAQDLNAVVLLKSNIDIITDGAAVKLNFTGNPGMTVGGTGDILSGIVGALLARHIAPFEAAVAGAFVNGAAGDFAKAEKGEHMVASDLLKWIPKAMDDSFSHLELKKGRFPKGF
ncbi:NAD(P)H-hydrate dehydratase [Candidatus Bathyarchaeota archaeon]|nr:NAD(P)H-hydrate dehydratase [Candidatus Bathyarchaeota archaeon]